MADAASVIDRARRELETVVPLPVDCGQVCDGRCCTATVAGTGMWLLPGESADIDAESTVTETPTGQLLVCGGACDRAKRPFACRCFPLFPYVEENGRIRAVYDPRGYRICPLINQCKRVALRRDFVRAVRRAGRILCEDTEIAAFLYAQSREIDQWNRLTRLDRERPPIARRQIRIGKDENR